MSYDIHLSNPGRERSVIVNHFKEGGTQPLNGTNEADLNITYNYGWFFFHLLDKDKGLRWLYGKKAKDCIKRLENAVKELGTNRYYRHPDGFKFNNDKEHDFETESMIHDYWAPTPGNAGYALNILLEWAREHPEAVFDGD